MRLRETRSATEFVAAQSSRCISLGGSKHLAHGARFKGLRRIFASTRRPRQLHLRRHVNSPASAEMIVVTRVANS